MKPTSSRKRHAGSALAAALIATCILCTVTATTLTLTLNRRRTVNESSVWEEALVAAEGGVHQGVAQLEQALSQNSLAANPTTGTGQTFTLNLGHSGEDSDAGRVQYTVTRNDVLTGGVYRPYYSIISTGTVNIPGGRSLSRDPRDIILRKLNLNGSTRTATRTVEAWVKPVYNTNTALKADKLITLNNFKIYVDSFNSGDPSRSITGGLPGPTVGQFNVAPYNIYMGNVATNSQFISAGDATIYGDAMTNGGLVGGSSGVQGEIRDDYYEPMAPVYPPTWANSVSPGVSVRTGNGNSTTTTTNVKSATTMRGGTQASPARYIVDSISLAGNSDVLTFDYGINGNSGSTDPSSAYIELYVRGDFTTKGGGTTSTDSGSVVVVQGVQVKIWVLGNVNLSGNGMTNNNGLASTFSLYGVNAPTATSGQSVTLAGNSRFFGTVYAPGADLKLAGGGSDGTFVGSLAGKTAFLNGNTSIRYDEALMTGGLITRFALVSWFEDTKKQGSFTGALQ